MKRLSPGEKQVWETPLDDHLMRTGATDVWDAIFTCFVDYRNADPEHKIQLLRDKGVSASVPQPRVSDWIQSFRDVLYLKHQTNNKDFDYKLFFKLLSLRFLELELMTFLAETLLDDTTEETFRKEVIEKTNMLAEYRLKKKAKEFKMEDVQDSIDRVLDDLLNETFGPILPCEEIQQLSETIGYSVLCIDQEGRILFDSCKFEDESCETIIICRLPDGFESIGRFSLTKDGHKRLSRLFSSGDKFLVKLREVADLNREKV